MMNSSVCSVFQMFSSISLFICPLIVVKFLKEIRMGTCFCYTKESLI